MIEAKQITKMVQHIIRRDRGASDPQIMHPMREWLIGISMTFIVGVFGSVFAAFLYHSYNIVQSTEIAAVATTTPYKVKNVEKALVEYREKRVAYDTLVGKTISIKNATTTEVAVPKDEVTESTTTKAIPVIPVEFPEAETPHIDIKPEISKPVIASGTPELAN